LSIEEKPYPGEVSAAATEQHSGMDGEIDAQFRFDDNLIVRHHDRLEVRHWSRPATRAAFGWTPMWRKTIRDRTAQQLGPA
jgi:hypothetical protein